MRVKNSSAYPSQEAALRAGHFLRATMLKDANSLRWCKENGVAITRAQNEGAGVSGGYALADDIAAAVIHLREEYSSFLRFANVVEMKGSVRHQPRLVTGATMYFTGEGNAVAIESGQTFDKVGLHAQKAVALVRTSTELGEDAPNILAESITTDLAKAFGETTDKCGWTADGTSQYGGMVGIEALLLDGAHDASRVNAATGHDTYAEIDMADLANVAGTLPARAIDRDTAWYCSQRGFGLVFARLAALGGGLPVIDGEVYFMGHPIRRTSALPQSTGSLTGKLLLAFGNLRMSSMVGVRRGLSIVESLLGPGFEFDQSLWRATSRFVVVNHDLGDNTNPGAMIGLFGVA